MAGALAHDARYALRMMARAPAFTVVAVACLALGIGAATAVFTLINSLMFRPLPVRERGQLVELLSRYPGEPRMNGFWWKFYEHYRDHNHVFSDLVGVSPVRFQVSLNKAEPDSVDGEYVVGPFFPALGIQPAIGRLIGPADDRIDGGDPAVAVVSWPYWQSRWQSSPSIVGSKVVLDGIPVTIVGVAPRSYSSLLPGWSPRLWVPAAFEPLSRRPSRRLDGQLPLHLVGRLAPGATIESARAELKVLDRVRVEELATRSRDPQWRLADMDVQPAGGGLAVLRDALARPLFALMAIVSLLLLIACTNVASMLLARASARRREIAVRVALGASKVRLLRQLLVESLFLSIPGGVLGLLLAWSGARVLAQSWPLDPRISDKVAIPVALDVHVLLFSAAIVIVTTVLFGLAPAWRGFAGAQTAALRHSGASSESRSRRLFGRSLVASQIALSVVLLTSAGLFVGEVLTLRYRDLGFEPGSVLLVTLNPNQAGYTPDHLAQLYDSLLPRLQAIPGVVNATLCGVSPIAGGAASRFVDVTGFVEPPTARRRVSLNWVAPAYFEVVRTPIVAGRDFTSADRSGPRVAVVNQAFARYYFGAAAAVGRHFILEGGRDYEIVGVAGDAKYSTLREPPPRTVYFNALQEGRGRFPHFAIRASGRPTAIAGEVRRAVADVLPAVPIARMTTLGEQVDASLLPERLVARLATTFGVLGAFLAGLGLYGLMAFTVTRRTSEIAVRMACGATRSDAVFLVLKNALSLAVMGVLAGVPIVVWGRRLAANIVELPRGTEAPVPFVLAALAMIGVAVIATLIPARRAARVEPMRALRHD